MSLGTDVDLEEFITMKDDLSGADIKAVCTEAGLLALRERRMRVNKADFTEAREKVRLLLPRSVLAAVCVSMALTALSSRCCTARLKGHRKVYICNIAFGPFLYVSNYSYYIDFPRHTIVASSLGS